MDGEEKENDIVVGENNEKRRRHGKQSDTCTIKRVRCCRC
jgi:hypothetical protein